MRREGEVVAVIDIDSPSFERFTAEDAQGLELIAEVLGRSVEWN